MWLHLVQANRWKGLIKAPFRREVFAEIDGYVSVNNRGIPQEVNIASLSEAGTESRGGTGERGEKDLNSKSFMGEGGEEIVA